VATLIEVKDPGKKDLDFHVTQVKPVSCDASKKIGSELDDLHGVRPGSKGYGKRKEKSGTIKELPFHGGGGRMGVLRGQILLTATIKTSLFKAIKQQRAQEKGFEHPRPGDLYSEIPNHKGGGVRKSKKLSYAFKIHLNWCV